MKQIKCTILYCVFVRTFVIPLYYGSGTIINYGSDSDFLTSYGFGSARQKVMVPTVSVQQHWRIEIQFFSPTCVKLGVGSGSRSGSALDWKAGARSGSASIQCWSTTSIANPDPASGFPDVYKSGSGSGIWIRDEQPGSYFQKLKKHFWG
jgi:hypothetical protein